MRRAASDKTSWKASALGTSLLTPEEPLPGIPPEIPQVLKKLAVLARLPAGLIRAGRAGAPFGQAELRA